MSQAWLPLAQENVLKSSMSERSKLKEERVPRSFFGNNDYIKHHANIAQQVHVVQGLRAATKTDEPVGKVPPREISLCSNWANVPKMLSISGE